MFHLICNALEYFSEKASLGSPAINKNATADVLNSSVLARTSTGDYVGIKVSPEKPENTQSEWSSLKNAVKLKKKLESGEILPEEVKDSLDFNVQISDADKKIIAEDGVPQIYQRKYDRDEQ